MNKRSIIHIQCLELWAIPVFRQGELTLSSI